jgi:uncharacterized membrane protein
MHSSRDGSPSPARKLAPARVAAAVLALSLLAISASQAARIFGVKCTSCESIAGRGIVALAGCVFYAAVLVALVIGWPPRRLIWQGLFAGLATHAVLIATSVIKGDFCPVCLAAAVLCLALWLVCAGDRKLSAQAFLILACLGFATGGILSALETKTLHYQFLARLPAESLAPPANSRVTLLVLEDSRCPGCEQFRNQWEGTLRKEFGDTLAIRFGKASEVGAPITPTFIVGADLRAVNVYEGEFPYTVVRGWILEHLRSSQ